MVHLIQVIKQNKLGVMLILLCICLLFLFLQSHSKYRTEKGLREVAEKEVQSMITQKQMEIQQKEVEYQTKNGLLKRQSDSLILVIAAIENLRLQIIKKYDNQIKVLNHLTPVTRNAYLDSMFRANGIR